MKLVRLEVENIKTGCTHEFVIAAEVDESCPAGKIEQMLFCSKKIPHFLKSCKITKVKVIMGIYSFKKIKEGSSENVYNEYGRFNHVFNPEYEMKEINIEI